jgi:hypothetical protein
MTPFAVYILTDGLLLGLLVCSPIWLFKYSAGGIWLKVALALASGVLVCWSPLASRAILGYPQPRALSDLPDRFQLLAENSADDQSFDLWIKSTGEKTPLAVTVVPDSQMRSVLRSAVEKFGQGVPVFINRQRPKDRPDNGHDAAADGAAGGASAEGNARNGGADDQMRWTFDQVAGISRRIKWSEQARRWR